MTYKNFDLSQQQNEPVWLIALPGSSEQLLTVNQLRRRALAGLMAEFTPIKDSRSGDVFLAKQIPGIFSSHEHMTLLLISWTLGVFGVDRFILGHTGLGVAKLLTFGGFGVWALIDFILIAMRKVTDSEGLPLA